MVACQDKVSLHLLVGRQVLGHIQTKIQSSIGQSLLMKIEFMHVIEKRQTAMFYHVDDSLLADVCIMTNYFCLCEWWFSAAVCSYKTAFCPKPSSFSMSDCAAAVSSHGSQRQRRGAPFPRQTCQCPPEWGVPLQGATCRIWLGGRQANMQQMALLFACRHIPSPSDLHLLGSTVPFPAAPWQQQDLSTGVQLSHDVTVPWMICSP